MERREFIMLLGGAAAVWPVSVRAQQRERMRRIGVLVSGLAAGDPEWQVRGTAFAQALQELGWSVGQNLQVDSRWGLGDADRLRRHAAELVALAPDVVLAGGGQAVAALQEKTRNLPIVFVNVTDPVGGGYVASLARPGGNATGFMSSEFSLSGKLLELLKQIAPRVTRVAVFRNTGIGTGTSQFAAIQTVAASLGVEVTALGLRDAGEIERGIITFARGPNDGLIVAAGGVTQIQRDMFVRLAARHRLPTVYPTRGFVTAGGLISYSPDRVEQYRGAAAYVDRILKGEKPADLPVQAPTKYETVINLKTAKALGLEVPASVRVRADEVIE